MKKNLIPPPFCGEEAFKEHHEKFMKEFGSLSKEDQEKYLTDFKKKVEEYEKQHTN